MDVEKEPLPIQGPTLRCSPAASKAHPAFPTATGASGRFRHPHRRAAAAAAAAPASTFLYRRTAHAAPGGALDTTHLNRANGEEFKEFAHIGPTKHMHIRRDSSQRVLAYSLMLSPSHSPAGGEEARPSTRSYASSCGASCISSPSAAYSSERSHRWSGEHGGERLPFGYLPRSLGSSESARISTWPVSGLGTRAGPPLPLWRNCRGRGGTARKG